MAQFFDATRQSVPEEGVVAETMDLEILSGVKTIVDKVNLEGVGRTKDEVLKKECQRIFQSENFEELVHNVDYTIKEFQRMGLFKAVGALIDVGSQANNYEVSFFVKEPNRLFGSIQTTVSGSGDTGLNVSVETPNAFGAGQKFRIEQGFGTKTKSHFTLSYGQPVQLSPLKHVSANIFRRNFLFDASGLVNVDHGVGVDLNSEIAPLTRHRIGWEGSWRFLNSHNARTPYEIREFCGHSLKSAIFNEIIHDSRDHAMLPEEGILARVSNEISGLGGDVKNLKTEANFQYNLPLGKSFVAQATFGCGFLSPFRTGKVVSIADRFFLGGLNFRGFAQNHVGPHAGPFALGGNVFWNSGFHFYAPLPFGDPHQPFLRNIRLHSFFNFGNLANDRNWKNLFANFPVSAGCGIVLALGKLARLEINFVKVLRSSQTEIQTGNFSFGFGVTYS